MAERFSGKRVLVTGAAGGMGFAIARQFASEGASLILTDIDARGLTKAASMLRDEGVDCAEQIADLSVEDDIHRLAQTLQTQGPTLDVLINNGGIAYGDVAYQFERLNQSQWL